MLFLHPSGGIEPALNGFSRELVGKGKTEERERERQREAERDKEGKQERKKGRVLGLYSDILFIQRERSEFLVRGWGPPALRAKESGVFNTWLLGLRALFVGPQEAGDFGAEQLDEGFGQHLLVLLCVLEVVLRVGQHLKEGLDELLVLQGGERQCQPQQQGWQRSPASGQRQPLLVWNRHTQRGALDPIPTTCSSRTLQLGQAHPLLPALRARPQHRPGSLSSAPTTANPVSLPSIYIQGLTTSPCLHSCCPAQATIVSHGEHCSSLLSGLHASADLPCTSTHASPHNSQ